MNLYEINASDDKNPPWFINKTLNLIKKNILEQYYNDNENNTNNLKTNKSFQNNLTLPTLRIFESCIEIKINLNFFFHTSLWCLKRFYEGLFKAP